MRPPRSSEFAKPYRTKDYERVTYTKLVTLLKKSVPEHGKYNVDYNKITKIFTNKRV
jgi:hypothetical protein